MSLAIRDISVVPWNDWSYYVAPTNFMVKTKNYYRLYPEVVIHCTSNGVPVPSQQDVIDYCCANLNIPCYETENHEPLVNAWTLGLPRPATLGCCGK